MMQIVIFDDDKRVNFFPITLNRSTGDLRCGILKLRQRLEAEFCGDDAANFLIDPILIPLYKERHPDWQYEKPGIDLSLFINSRIVLTEEAIKEISSMKANTIVKHDDAFVAACLPISSSEFQKLIWSANIDGSMSVSSTDIKLYDNLSELIHDNERLIRWDFDRYFYDKDNSFETEPGVTVLHPYNVWLAENVQLSPGVVLDASEGPIIIDESAKVMANAVLCGPLYVGKRSLVKIGAKIYGNTSIGPVCKVGGEIEGCIIQAYSNKQHDGFLGHAYIGEWVNMGADTNNSDLKNNYKSVNYYSYAQKAKIDSGSQFLGCIIGDHAKTGINCSINTGTVIGMGCNVYGSHLISDFIPDFSWGEASLLMSYRFDAFCATTNTVKNRRKLSLTDIEKELYKQIYSMEK